MLQLENFYRWSIWKFRRVFNLDGQTIAPIIRGPPLLKAGPSEELKQKLDADSLRKLVFIYKEVELISRLSRYFPSNINDDNWVILMKCDNRKQRIDYIKFLRKRELIREKAQVKRVLLEEQRNKVKDMGFNVKRNSEHRLFNLTFSKIDEWERRSSWYRVAHAHRLSDGPSLVVDCRFLPFLSYRGAELTTLQLKFLVTANRDRRSPWPLYFVNFNEDESTFLRLKQRHLSMLNSPNSSSPVTSPYNYVDLFPKEKIIYLSPNADEDLEEIFDDHIYVIGGIVDRVPEKKIDPHASLITANMDGVRSARLPLDKYMKWQSGSRFLALPTVMCILQDVYESNGDWETALKKNVPIRHVRSVHEKCSVAKDHHNRIRQFDREIWQIVTRQLGNEY